MRIEQIQVSGEMGILNLRRGEGKIIVKRQNGQELSTDSIDELAVAIDGIGFADHNGADDLFEYFDIKAQD